MNLQELPNIGKKLEEQLKAVGIESAEDLRKAGAENAWLAIQKNDPSACIMRLTALAAAIENVRRTELSDERKAELKAFYHEHKIPRVKK